MKASFVSLAVLAAGLVLIGCSPNRDAETRYKLEKQLWTAQRLEKKISSKYPYDTQMDWAVATAAYETVLAGVPDMSESDVWRPVVVKDIEGVALMAKLGLIRLCFQESRSNAAVSYFKAEIFDPRTISLGAPEIRLERASSLYSSIDVDTLACRSLLFDVIDSGALATNYVNPGDTLLGFPIYFAEVVRDKGDNERYAATIEAGERFYGQIIDSWADSLSGRQALYYRAQFRLLDGRLDAAEADVNRLLEEGHRGVELSDLLFLKGYILGAEGRLDEARHVYGDLPESRRVPVSVGYLGRLNVAEIDIADGEYERAFAALEAIEHDDDAPQELVARAALVRALALERQGQWKQSLELLTWTCRLYPYTLSAMYVPLIAVRHDVAAGNMREGKKNLELATQYYLNIIAKDSAFLPFRHIAKDFLVECYLLMGRVEEVAALLETQGQKWGGENGSVALFKSGLIYMNLLGDREKAAKTFKKSVELFPQTRYSRVTQSQLDRMATPQNGMP